MLFVTANISKFCVYDHDILRFQQNCLGKTSNHEHIMFECDLHTLSEAALEYLCIVLQTYNRWRIKFIIIRGLNITVGRALGR